MMSLFLHAQNYPRGVSFHQPWREHVRQCLIDAQLLLPPHQITSPRDLS
jgi:hypothetical protein